MKKGEVFVLGILVGVMLVAAEIAVLTWCDNNLNVATDAVEYRDDHDGGGGMKNACKDCPERQFYDRRFDMHFSGADCWFECEYADDDPKNDVEAEEDAQG